MFFPDTLQSTVQQPAKASKAASNGPAIHKRFKPVWRPRAVFLRTPLNQPLCSLLFVGTSTANRSTETLPSCPKNSTIANNHWCGSPFWLLLLGLIVGLGNSCGVGRQHVLCGSCLEILFIFVLPVASIARHWSGSTRLLGILAFPHALLRHTA